MTPFRTMLIVAAAAILVLGGCRSSPVQNIQNAQFGSPTYASSSNLTLDDYERAIIRAGAQRGWTFERVEPGHLIGTVVVRGRHTAVVDVTFTTESYSITYNSSRNLNHDSATGEIHSNYNSWVENLRGDIQREVQTLRAS